MREQAATLLHVSNLFYIPQQTQLAKLLCDHSFADRVFFCNSGGEANESAIKLARKWAKEHGASDRGDITRAVGFHGGPSHRHRHARRSTPMASSRCRGFRVRSRSRAVEGPSTATPPGHGRADQARAASTPADATSPAPQACDDADPVVCTRSRPAWCAPSARGTSTPASSPRHDPREGWPTAADRATLATESVASAFTPGTHGSTFGGNPFATAVGLTVFMTLMEERLPERAAATGRLLRDQLEVVRGRYPKVATAVRGRGLLVGVDLVPPVGDVIGVCRERGLLALSAGNNTLRLAPPLVTDEATCAAASRSSISPDGFVK